MHTKAGAENSTQKWGGVMWGGCKLQSVLKSFTACTLVSTAAEAYQHKKLANTRGIWGHTPPPLPPQEILRFECFEIKSKSIFSGTSTILL